MYGEDVAVPLPRAPAVPVALRVLCPPTLLSVSKSGQSHSGTCAKEEAWRLEALRWWGVREARVASGERRGVSAARCYVTALSPTAAALYQRSGVAEVQPNVDIEELLKESRKR